MKSRNLLVAALASAVAIPALVLAAEHGTKAKEGAKEDQIHCYGVNKCKGVGDCGGTRARVDYDDAVDHSGQLRNANVLRTLRLVARWRE